ncbi:MAG TPA: hypothetical protein VFV32_14325 [Acidimicrobiales bacterium]|nr:hypothetical protein [Acidimicrobiales bacterium]
MTRTRIAALTATGLLGLASITGLSACSDEDNDGGTTDEEIQDGKDTVTSVGDELQEEVDAQDEGTNEDGE